MSLQPVYYYVRDDENKPRVTICIIVDTEAERILSRGIALCSFKDCPNKKIGRKIAEGRAWKGINGFQSDVLKEPDIHRWSAYEVLGACSVDASEYQIRKSMFLPTPTMYEKRLMEGIVTATKKRNENEEANVGCN
jgi:hypothetical protein